jgi:hypothetical protein
MSRAIAPYSKTTLNFIRAIAAVKSLPRVDKLFDQLRQAIDCRRLLHLSEEQGCVAQFPLSLNQKKGL